MKKNVISIMLSIAIVTGSISAAPVHAVERDVQAEEAVHAEEEAAQEEEPKAAIVPIYGFSRPSGLGRFCFFIPTKDAKGLS